MQWSVIVVLLLVSPMLAASRSQVRQHGDKRHRREPLDVSAGAAGKPLGSNDTGEADGGSPGAVEGKAATTGEPKRSGSRRLSAQVDEPRARPPSSKGNDGDGSRHNYAARSTAVPKHAVGSTGNNSDSSSMKDKPEPPVGNVKRIPSNPLIKSSQLIAEGTSCGGTVLPHEEWCNDCMCLRGSWYCTGKWCNDYEKGSHASSSRPRPRPLHNLPLSYTGRVHRPGSQRKPYTTGMGLRTPNSQIFRPWTRTSPYQRGMRPLTYRPGSWLSQFLTRRPSSTVYHLSNSPGRQSTSLPSALDFYDTIDDTKYPFSW